MSGVVANDLVGTDVTLSDCRVDQAWLRSARLDHCDVLDCELTGTDWYGAQIERSRLLRCSTTASCPPVCCATSPCTDRRWPGCGARRDVVIGSDQVVEVAVALFATQGIVIDDEVPFADDSPPG